jgi:hypothetical protein
MSYLFEELIRRFSEQFNETAGERFTPRKVIQLLVRLLAAPDGVTTPATKPSSTTGSDSSSPTHPAPAHECCSCNTASGEALSGAGD